MKNTVKKKAQLNTNNLKESSIKNSFTSDTFIVQRVINLSAKYFYDTNYSLNLNDCPKAIYRYESMNHFFDKSKFLHAIDNKKKIRK